MLTQDRLREILRYNPCTGEFRWRISRKKAPQGKLAGALKKCGRRSVFYYRIIKVDWITYRSGRLAWFYVYGEWPDTIDHIDGNSLNDSFWNLSNGTQVDNMRNPISVARMSVAAIAREGNKRRYSHAQL